MPSSLRVEDDVFELFHKVKKGLEKQAEVVTGTPPRYTQSNVVKIVCEHYLNTVLKEGEG